ncbi:MAG TPA: YihY/virulence factor BrkB family protein, partial [Dehalococcoidia bacterium]|nr:YihY/virulence factor BrkB family protein [Dehalococcoidia bacterium]
RRRGRAGRHAGPRDRPALEMATSPSGILATGKQLVKEIGEDDVSGLAAEMAYRLLLAMFPFFIFLAAVGAFVASALNIDNPTERIMDSLGDALPQDAASVLEDQLQQVLGERNLSLLSLGILAAIWTASGAMNTLIKALNRVYDIQESRPIWKKYPLAVGLTLLAGFFFISAFTVLLIGQFVTREIADELGMSSIARTLLYWGRFPIAAALLLAVVAFLYWAAPNAKMPFRWVTPGALAFMVAWIAFTVGFGFYVANFGSYNSTYGTLGGVVVLMVWLYLSSFLLLAAAELNAIVLAEVETEQPSASRATTPGTPPDNGAEDGHSAARGGSPDVIPGAAAIALGGTVAALSAWRALTEPASSEEDRAETGPAEEQPAPR